MLSAPAPPLTRAHVARRARSRRPAAGQGDSQSEDSTLSALESDLARFREFEKQNEGGISRLAAINFSATAEAPLTPAQLARVVKACGRPGTALAQL